MKRIIIFLILLATTSTAYAGELALAKSFCDNLNGKAEVVLKDRTRVDCLTDEYAFEVDYAPKWAESVAQSLHYSNMTGKKPAIAIIISNVKDVRYIVRLANVLIGINPAIYVTTINNF